jgi:hypothetical protein
VLYSLPMKNEDRIAAIAHRLRAWGVGELAASMLEVSGPLTFLGAQALYFAGATFAPFAPEEDVLALAGLFENPASVRILAERLTEEL